MRNEIGYLKFVWKGKIQIRKDRIGKLQICMEFWQVPQARAGWLCSLKKGFWFREGSVRKFSLGMKIGGGRTRRGERRSQKMGQVKLDPEVRLRREEGLENEVGETKQGFRLGEEGQVRKLRKMQENQVIHQGREKVLGELGGMIG